MIYLLPIFAVIIGFFIALYLKPSNAVGLKLLLSFSGAYLLSVTVFEFLPAVYHTGNEFIGLFIMAGILLQILLEFFSQGAEHGHLHQDKNTTAFPVLLLLSLCIHSFLEGFPLNQHEHLLFGVVLHKVPVAIILAAFLLKSDVKRAKVFLFLSIFAAMTPLGSWFSSAFRISGEYQVYMNSLVIGIFLHISTTILFEASKNHKFNASKLISILAGILIAYFL